MNLRIDWSKIKPKEALEAIPGLRIQIDRELKHFDKMCRGAAAIQNQEILDRATAQYDKLEHAYELVTGHLKILITAATAKDPNLKGAENEKFADEATDYEEKFDKATTEYLDMYQVVQKAMKDAGNDQPAAPAPVAAQQNKFKAEPPKYNLKINMLPQELEHWLTLWDHLLTIIYL